MPFGLFRIKLQELSIRIFSVGIMQGHLAHVLFLLLAFITLSTPLCQTRDEDAAKADDPTRTCRKACTEQSDCTGSKKCECDDLCGMSCFNPEAECPDRTATVENGGVRYPRGREYDARAIYFCDNGFFLTGERERTCRSTREWSHHEPNCTRGCPPPKSRGNGYPEIDPDIAGYKPGATVEYNCRTGYQGSGDFSVTCQNDYTWTTASFTCLILNCGHPGDIDHGYLEGNDFVFGSTVKYFCNPGYETTDATTRKCFAEGFWEPKGPLPTCRPIPCIPVSAINNGKVDTSAAIEGTFGQVVYYSCDVGYKLVGPSRGQCNENGTWGAAPVCKEDLDCSFENSVNQLCGYTKVSGTFARANVAEDKDMLPGYAASGKGILRSILLPLNETHKVCMEVFHKDTEPNSLRAEAYNGDETKLLRKLDESSAWESAKFWLTTVRSGDTEVQLQFAATSDVLIDSIKELSPSECGGEGETSSTTPRSRSPTVSPRTTTNVNIKVENEGFAGWKVALIVLSALAIAALAGFGIFKLIQAKNVNGAPKVYIKGNGDGPEKVETARGAVPTTEV